MSQTILNKTLDTKIFVEKRESADSTGNNQTLNIY